MSTHLYMHYIFSTHNVPTNLWETCFLDVKRLIKTGLHHFVSCTNRTYSDLKNKNDGYASKTF